VVAAVITGIELSGASAVAPADDAVGGPAGACPLGGTATRVGSFPFVTVTLSACALATAEGSVTFDGTAMVQLTTVSVDIAMQFRDSGGGAGQHVTAELSGTLSPTLGGTCFLTAAMLQVSSGEMVVSDPAGHQVSMGLAGTAIAVGNLTFDSHCLPTRYRLTFNGPVSFAAGAAGPLNAALADLAVDVDARTAPATQEINGDMSSSCFGGTAGLSTATALVTSTSQVCPTAGRLLAGLMMRTDAIAFRAGGAVDLDTGNDGSIDQSLTSCVDSSLFTCVP